MPKKGKFIVIEGSDGVGKKTQTGELTKLLRRVGQRVAFYDFPQYDKSFFGAMVARYLNGEFGQVGDVSPYLISLFYAGDRFEAADNIRHDLNLGKIVISNRYTQSNLAFQSAKLKVESEKKVFLEWLEELEFGIYHIPRPDLIIYLYLPYERSQEMVDKKGERRYTDKKRDIHESNSDYLAQVEKEYLKLADDNPEWRIIDCSAPEGILPVPEITKKIFQAIEKEVTGGNHRNQLKFGI